MYKIYFRKHLIDCLRSEGVCRRTNRKTVGYNQFTKKGIVLLQHTEILKILRICNFPFIKVPFTCEKRVFVFFALFKQMTRNICLFHRIYQYWPTAQVYSWSTQCYLSHLCSAIIFWKRTKWSVLKRGFCKGKSTPSTIWHFILHAPDHYIVYYHSKGQRITPKLITSIVTFADNNSTAGGNHDRPGLIEHKIWTTSVCFGFIFLLKNNHRWLWTWTKV